MELNHQKDLGEELEDRMRENPLVHEIDIDLTSGQDSMRFDGAVKKVEFDDTRKEVSAKTPALRTVSVDYESMMQLVNYADEMAKHIMHFCTVVDDTENEESLALLCSYQNFRGSADADHGERKAPTLQEVPESELAKQANS